MRKLIAVAVAALALAAVTATTAGAQTVTKFSVQTASSHGHRTSTGFRVTGRLAEVGEPSETVGSYKADFSRGGHVRAVAFFPDGKLKVNGDQSNHKVPIVGGSRRWNGASGKMKFHSIGRNEAILTFTVVQG